MKLYLCSAAFFLVCAMPASAQTLDTTTTSVVPVPVGEEAPHTSGVKGTIALGAAFTPKYDGSSHYQAVPFGLVGLKFGNVEVNLVGFKLKVNLVGDSHFEYGPVIGLSPARKQSDTVGRVAQLNTFGASVNGGAYVAYRLGGNATGQGRITFSLQATQDIKNSRGFTVEPGISYIAIRNRHVLLNFDASTKINSANYMRTNFGITPDEATRSGLAAYRPSGGLSEVAGGATAAYQLTRHWGLLARAQVGTYVGKASDSPIVQDGSKTFHMFALGVGYTF